MRPFPNDLMYQVGVMRESMGIRPRFWPIDCRAMGVMYDQNGGGAAVARRSRRDFLDDNSLG
ncbi:hypothetical protein Pan216_22110 [Planctomycetes bacterium Pan216]|uniref:Uncharacterized protein n=1 Tax=Kolteria novifilia TaxID=2527975 RepID=A0A518B301_9BACT|nr:hypothetical protein Pan216_22110 [Planctomycetes bacterium Pan216]